jgi:hypothetical protein
MSDLARELAAVEEALDELFYLAGRREQKELALSALGRIRTELERLQRIEETIFDLANTSSVPSWVKDSLRRASEGSDRE